MKTIGPYKVLGVCTGGTHPLYRVEGPGSQVLVLKTLSTASMTTDDRARFEREAQVGRHLVYRNLLPVLDFSEADGALYQATELLAGSDLSNVLERKKSMTWQEKISIMEQICEGMEYAYAREFVHRDLKPANVFVEDTGRVRQCGHLLGAETIAVAAHDAHHRAKVWWFAAAAVVGVAVILDIMMVFLADRL